MQRFGGSQPRQDVTCPRKVGKPPMPNSSGAGTLANTARYCRCLVESLTASRNGIELSGSMPASRTQTTSSLPTQKEGRDATARRTR